MLGNISKSWVHVHDTLRYRPACTGRRLICTQQLYLRQLTPAAHLAGATARQRIPHEQRVQRAAWQADGRVSRRLVLRCRLEPAQGDIDLGER